MRTYTLKKVQGQPDWNTVPVMPIDSLYKVVAKDVSAQAQVCWNEEALHVRLCAVESPLRTEEVSETAQVCNDSCLEFFIRPTEKMEYFNFEWNPICNLYLGFGTPNGTSELVRLLVRNREKVFCAESKTTDNGWEVTFKIPYSFILRFFDLQRILTVLAGLAAILMYVFNTGTPAHMAWSILALGFFSSAIYTTIITLGSQQTKVPSPKLVNFVLTCGTIGTMLTFVVTGPIVEHSGPQAALLTANGLYAVVFVMCFLLGFVSRHRQHNTLTSH